MMSFAGQVLVIAFFAVDSKLLLWSMEEDVVDVDVELDRKDLVHLDDSWLRFRAGSRPEGAEGLSLQLSIPGRIGDRYV
jgi:hypothetical protein